MDAPIRTTKKSNDFTGRQAAELAAKAVEEQRASAERMSLMTAQQEQEFEETVHDMTRPSSPALVDEVVEIGVVLADDTVVVRVAENIDNMTYGHDNHYTFKAGGKYKVPRGVAERLSALGLLYERL